MTKEQYVNETAEINAKKRILDQQIYELDKQAEDIYSQYINDNREFQANDKVRLYSKKNDTLEGFISGCGAHDDGKIYYRFNRIKKDGSAAAHRLYIPWSFELDRIELIEKAKP